MWAAHRRRVLATTASGFEYPRRSFEAEAALPVRRCARRGAAASESASLWSLLVGVAGLEPEVRSPGCVAHAAGGAWAALLAACEQRGAGFVGRGCARRMRSWAAGVARSRHTC